MKRIKLVVAYDGTCYHGCQIQPNAITVEGVLNQALSELLGEEIMVAGTSRTDAGVHAYGNVAVFDSETRIPGEKISYALNQRLPEDIVIQSSEEVSPEFHPRYQKSDKTYEYRILNRKFPLPIERKYAHFVYETLDIDGMREAAAYLVGEHDFASFCSAGSQVQDTVRTINFLEIEERGDLLCIRINGNGFLYNMVRIIAGTLLQVGSGVREPISVKEALEAKNREAAGPTAPAKGLHLLEIHFKG